MFLSGIGWKFTFEDSKDDVSATPAVSLESFQKLEGDIESLRSMIEKLLAMPQALGPRGERGETGLTGSKGDARAKWWVLFTPIKIFL